MIQTFVHEVGQGSGVLEVKESSDGETLWLGSEFYVLQITMVANEQRWCCDQVRSGCAFMIHICEDEHQLFFHFFTSTTPLLK